jgi:outer membrane lipoprotein LolB
MRILFGLILVFFLTSCATTKQAPVEPAQNQNVAWDNRVDTVSHYVNWDLKSLISIRNQADATTATLNWQQQNKRYQIVIFGPVGTGSYELTGQPGKVELAESSGKRFYATSPEQLLLQRAGWRLPVSNLFYWIRGLPVPNVPSEKEWDSYHHLTVLKQQNWTIRFLSYTSVNNIDLPNKIFLDNPQLNVKIVIHEWKI